MNSSWIQGNKPVSSFKLPNYAVLEQRESQEKVNMIKSILEEISLGKNPSVFSDFKSDLMKENYSNKNEYINSLQKSLLDYRNNYAISLVLKEEKNKREMRFYLEHFKKVISSIFIHLRDEKNLLGYLCGSFKKYFLEKYDIS